MRESLIMKYLRFESLNLVSSVTMVALLLLVRVRREIIELHCCYSKAKFGYAHYVT